MSARSVPRLDEPTRRVERWRRLAGRALKQCRGLGPPRRPAGGFTHAFGLGPAWGGAADALRGGTCHGLGLAPIGPGLRCRELDPDRPGRVRARGNRPSSPRRLHDAGPGAGYPACRDRWPGRSRSPAPGLAALLEKYLSIFAKAASARSGTQTSASLGAQTAGSLAWNTARVGAPRAAARWVTPLSAPA